MLTTHVSLSLFVRLNAVSYYYQTVMNHCISGNASHFHWSGRKRKALVMNCKDTQQKGMTRATKERTQIIYTEK